MSVPLALGILDILLLPNWASRVEVIVAM